MFCEWLLKSLLSCPSDVEGTYRSPADGLLCAGSALPGGYCRMNLSTPQEGASTGERGNLLEALLPPLGLILGGVLGEFSFIRSTDVKLKTILSSICCQVKHRNNDLESNFSVGRCFRVRTAFSVVIFAAGIVTIFWGAKIFFIQIDYCKLKCVDFTILNHGVPYLIFYKGSKSMVWSNLFNVYYWREKLFNFNPIRKQENFIFLTKIKTPFIVY